MKAIVAQNLIGYIGLENQLPWYSPDDLKYFKEKTSEGSGAIIVGFTTAQTLPFLKNRIAHIINTREGNWYEELKAFTDKYPDAWIIGGRKTYKLLLHLIDEVHISLIDDTSEGDVLAPQFAVHSAQQIKVIKNHFKGVSNFEFMEQFLSTARRKGDDVKVAYNFSEDCIRVMMDSKTSDVKLYEIKISKTLVQQPKEVKEFIYNYITT